MLQLALQDIKAVAASPRVANDFPKTYCHLYEYLCLHPIILSTPSQSKARNICTRASISQKSSMIVMFVLVRDPSSLLPGRLGLIRSFSVSSDLPLGFFVAVRDETVQEAVGTALRVALGLCALDLAVQVAGGLFVDVVLVVRIEVGCSLGHWVLAQVGGSDAGFGEAMTYGFCRAWTACA